jgi:hypothetical protein
MRNNIAAIAALICFVGCDSNVAIPDGTGFTLVAGYSGYRYTAWLNNEPIASSYAQSTATLYGFPLQTGSNHVTVKMEILPPPAPPPLAIKLIVLVRDKPTKNAEWIKVDGYDESGPYSNSQYVLESGFKLKGPVRQTSKDFDSIVGDKESFRRRVQQLALKFTAELRDGNETEWARLWGPAGPKEFWACRERFPSTNGFAMNSISKASEMVVESGSHLMLVHAKSGALVELLVDGKVQEGGYTDFLFARSGGKWCVIGADRNWWKLPDELQHF